MKKFFNLANGTLLLFLLASMMANIMQGKMTYRFTQTYNENHAEAVKRAMLLIRHDSAADKRGDALLRGQIETHLEILALRKEVEENNQLLKIKK